DFRSRPALCRAHGRSRRRPAAGTARICPRARQAGAALPRRHARDAKRREARLLPSSWHSRRLRLQWADLAGPFGRAGQRLRCWATMASGVVKGGGVDFTAIEPGDAALAATLRFATPAAPLEARLVLQFGDQRGPGPRAI